MPSIDYQTLRQTVVIEEVLDLLEFIPSERKNDQVRFPCPILKSKSPGSRSYCANLIRNTCQCFTCCAKGNQLALSSQARSLPLHAAAIDLCSRLHLDVLVLGQKSPSSTEKRNP